MLLQFLLTSYLTPSSSKEMPKTRTVGDVNFVFIKTGEFLMGQPNPSLVFQGSSKDEQPVHRVRISSFWMGMYEVTQKQYQNIMGENPSSIKGDKYPVESVHWHKAKEFCQKFSAKYKVKARLPYEAEWEYACRAGTSTRYFWGDKVDGRYCWHAGNAGMKTHPVGQKLPNPWGLYDMAGNVWEWCEDWYDENYYKSSPLENPKGPATGKVHVMRGGWGDGLENGLRSSVRCWSFTDYGFDGYIGFRIVLEP